jgi:pimeloyl-ACP methyl ester carboxylesterase
MSGVPCVIYMHGNASCQLEGQFLVPNFCPYGVCLFCFDFIGCGCSEGKYISLGYYEKQDTEAIVRFLHNTYHLGPFVLWGRSMGAAAALLVDLPGQVVGKISDSAFTSIPAEIAGIAAMVKVPSVFIPAATWFLKKKVIKLADFDLSTVSPLKAVQRISCPTVFGHAEGDQFVPFAHLAQLHAASICQDKHQMVLPGGHNTRRSVAWLELGVRFALEKLDRVVTNFVVVEARRLQESSAHFESFRSLIANTRAQGEVDDDFADPVLQQIAEVAHEEEQIRSEQMPEPPPEAQKAHRKHHKKQVETQTLDLFGLPPLAESLSAPVPE